MTVFPTIYCNGSIFRHVNSSNGDRYVVTGPGKENFWLVSVRDGVAATHQPVDPRGSQFAIDEDLKVEKRAIRYTRLSTRGILISAVATACLMGIKKNYRLGALGAILTLACSVSASYFYKQCRNANFIIANKLISFLRESQSLLFNPADYGL